MDRLKIIGTAHTPYIDFDPENKYFIISGRSITEDDLIFYPWIMYLKNYIKELKSDVNKDNISLKFDFKLIYYNTLSIRYLNSTMELLVQIKEIVKKLTVKWYYDSMDEYLEEMGEMFNESFDLGMELIKVEANLKRKK